MNTQYYDNRKLLQDLYKSSLLGQTKENILDYLFDLFDGPEVGAKEYDDFNRRIVVVYIKQLTHLEQEEIIESIRSAIESFVRNENIDVNKDLEQMITSTNCFDHYWIGDTLTIQL